MTRYSGAFPIEAALADPFIAQYAALIYTSPSHRDDWHKFRVIFILSKKIEDPEFVKSLILYLHKRYPHTDGSTKDLCRAWFGNTNANFPLYQEVTLPESFLEEVRVYNIERLAEERRQREERERYRAEYLAQREKWGIDDEAEKNLVSEALKYCPPRQPGTGTYSESLSVLTAIKAVWGEAGRAIAENWSPSTNEWDIDHKWDGLDESDYGPQNIFAVAKRYGWSFPQRSQSANSSNKPVQPTRSGEDFSDYLAELKRLNAIKDPIRKSFETFQFFKSAGYPIRQIENALSNLNQRSKPQFKTVFELDEFLALAFEAEEWIIDGLVPAGETILLAGLPKEGKSLVGYDLAYSVATGRAEFLGVMPNTKGRVLLILSDESPRSAQGRLRKRGFKPEDAGQVRVLTHFNLKNLAELEDLLLEFQPCLTIIDSLKSITQGSEVSENSAEFADAVYALKEMLNRHQSAGILIHHSNKDREAQGVAQVRGSTAIAGAVWGCWVLKTPKRKSEELPKDRWLEINPREGERKTLTIELDPTCNTWKLIASTELPKPDDATAIERVKALLKSFAGKGLEFSEIREHLNDIKRETLSTSLNRLVDSGVVGKRASETNYNSWVYYVVSPPVSSGFINDCEVVSPPVSPLVSTTHETRGETTRNGYHEGVLGVGFILKPPRGTQDETRLVSEMVSSGFTHEEVIDCDDL